MSSLVSSITLQFKDNFSSGYAAATRNMGATQQKIASAAKEIQNGSGMMSVARDMSVISMQMGQFSNQLQSLTSVPGQVASSYQDGMARVSTVLNASNAVGGDTVRSMDMIRDAAEKMAGGIGTAGKLASVGTDIFSNSVYTMLSSGLTVQQGIAATRQAALLAKATSGEMGDAASALTGIYNNLGDKTANAGEEMTRLSDIVAGTQNYFAFENLGQFTEGLKNASGAAVANKIPLTQLSATIGQLNSNMITGAEAGTAVKSIVAQLGNASNRLGFEIAKTSNGGIDLIKTFENIKATGADGQAMMKAFGTEAGPAISLLTENLKDLKSGYDYVNDSSGITLKNAAKMAETLTTKQENLNNAMLVFQGRLGAGSNTVKSIGLSAQMAGIKFLNWATDIPVVGTALAGVTGGAMQLTGSMAGVANIALQSSTGILSFVGLMEKAPAIMTTMKAGLSLVGLQIKGVSAGLVSAIPSAVSWIGTMWAAAAAHMAVAWPIYAVIAGVAALAAGAYFLIKNWDTVKTWTKQTWQTIKGLFFSGFNFVKRLFTESPAWVQVALLAFAPWIAVPMQIIKHFGTLKQWFSSFVGWITTTAEKVAAPFKWISDTVGGVFNKDSGRKMTETMASGITSDNSLYNATSTSFKKVDRLIPHSNAAEGPFSRLTHAGSAITGTMASGLSGNRSLFDMASQKFSAIGDIIPFPGTDKTGILKSLFGKFTSRKGDTTNHYNITISFDDLKDFPTLMDYLISLKEETDRVPDPEKVAI